MLRSLSEATNLLSQAENAYRSGDSNAAATHAGTVLPIAQEVILSAQSAKQTALGSIQNGFWSSIVFTVAASVAFILLLFIAWRRFKRSYINSSSDAN